VNALLHTERGRRHRLGLIVKAVSSRGGEVTLESGSAALVRLLV
jgi:hypothetical protein